MQRNPHYVLATYVALTLAIINRGVQATKAYTGQIQENEIDLCGLVSEENHTGRIFVEFVGHFDLLSDDEVVDLQSALADVYQEASRENCMYGFRALSGVEIDRTISFSTPAENQFRVHMNVLVKCKGCSEDLRFFSSPDGRTQGRFLEGQLRQNGVNSTLLKSFSEQRNSDKFNQKSFLDRQGCFCSPPSRDRIVRGIRDRIKIIKEQGKLPGILGVASIGAYAPDFEDDKDPEIEASNTSSQASCSVPPPFSSPIALADYEVFNIFSLCPFLVHEQASGQAFDGCFPMYTVPNWDSPSISFEINPIQGGASLYFEKEQNNIASWEEILEVYPGYSGEFNSCFEQLDFEAVGVNGDVSGANGTISLSTVIVSYTEQEQVYHILLPFGGCEDAIVEGHGRIVRQRPELTSADVDYGGGVSKRTLQDPSKECKVRPAYPMEGGWSGCLEICYTVAESAFKAEVEKLTPLRHNKLLKDISNEEAVIEKMFLTRGAQVAFAFARCKCTIISADELGGCVLQAFLDIVASEADLGFEAEEVFGQHRSYVESWYETSVQHACVVAVGSAINCHTNCNGGV